MGISHFHGFHKHPLRTTEESLEKRSNCANGLYLAPKMGQSVDAMQPLPISWDPTCMTSQALDIYLYSPGSQYPRIHVWEGIALGRGTYTAELKPRWWNATSSQTLQILIVPSGGPTFGGNFAAGPLFTATYTAPTNGTTPAAADTNQIDSGITPVNDLANQAKAMTPGKKAAAVLIPFIFIGLGIAAFIRFKRSRGQEKRKKWSEAVDKRMSTISADWKSVSGAGANAAIRNSMAVGNRNSSFSFGGIRPSSTYAVEGEDTEGRRSISQMRTGVGLRNPAALSSTERISRVSFAPDTRVSRVSFADSRPSGESRRTRAFHSAYIPPVPALPDNTDDQANDHESDDASARFSPRQAQGPMTLTTDDIRARISKEKPSTPEQPSNPGHEIDDFLPALSMMRSGSDPSAPDDFLFPPPAPPAPAHPKAVTSTPQQMTSPVMSTMPMQPMPAAVMSPDEMLRAYAERKKSMTVRKSIAGAKISYPMPIANASSSGNMRVLYDAATGSLSPTNTGNNEADAYDYNNTAAYDYNNNRNSVVPNAPASISQSMYSDYSTGEVLAGQYAFGRRASTLMNASAYGGAQYAIGDDEEDVGVAGRGTYKGYAT